jgi:hypothetical protein
MMGGHIETCDIGMIGMLLALAAQAGAVPPMVTAGFALKILRSLGERERCAAVMPAGEKFFWVRFVQPQLCHDLYLHGRIW